MLRSPMGRQDALHVSLTLIQGFLNFDYTEKLYDEFQSEVSKGITDGHIQYRENIVDGIENAPSALLGMLEGKNFGKLLIRIREPHVTQVSGESR